MISLTINRHPLNSSDEQKAVLEKITNFLQMYWDETLDLELENIQDICSKSDIDFEFVLDQSGSIGPADWKLTLDIIAEVGILLSENLYMKTFQQWISTAIRPRGSKVCGNHVAGRKFSGLNEFSHTRFLDFEPPEPNNYYPEYSSYTDYVANVFKTQE